MCSYRRLRLKPSSECLFVFGNSTLLVWFSSVFHACGFSDGCRPHRASKCNKFSYQSQSALKPHPEHTRKQFHLIIIWLVLSFWRNCEPLMNARTARTLPMTSFFFGRFQRKISTARSHWQRLAFYQLIHVSRFYVGFQMTT